MTHAGRLRRRQRGAAQRRNGRRRCARRHEGRFISWGFSLASALSERRDQGRARSSLTLSAAFVVGSRRAAHQRRYARFYRRQFHVSQGAFHARLCTGCEKWRAHQSMSASVIPSRKASASTQMLTCWTFVIAPASIALKRRFRDRVFMQL